MALLLLGFPGLSDQGPRTEIPLSRRAVALLAYLAASPGRLFARAHLGALLWERGDETVGRGNLRTLLSRLRKTLPAWPLREENDGVGWNPGAVVAVDTMDFLHLTEKGDSASLEAALALWRGPFLENFALPESEAYEEWLAGQREDWNRRLAGALGALGTLAEAGGDWERLEGYARQGLDADPLEERFHRWEMAARTGRGDRTGALRAYEKCRRVLERELGVVPDPATLALREAIAAGTARQDGKAAPTAVKQASPPPPAANETGISEQLDVILVEDEGLYRDLLGRSLAQSGRVRVLGSFADGESALAEAPSMQPRVAILDIMLGSGLNGFQVGRLLRRRLPGLGVVLLSNHADPSFLATLPPEETAGWSYLLKPSVADLASLVRAVDGAAGGLVVLDPRLVRGAKPRENISPARLTPRQEELLELLAQGYGQGAIAKSLDLSRGAVEEHLDALYRKLAVRHDPALPDPKVQAVLAYLRENRFSG